MGAESFVRRSSHRFGTRPRSIALADVRELSRGRARRRSSASFERESATDAPLALVDALRERAAGYDARRGGDDGEGRRASGRAVRAVTRVDVVGRRGGGDDGGRIGGREDGAREARRREDVQGNRRETRPKGFESWAGQKNVVDDEEREKRVRDPARLNVRCWRWIEGCLSPRRCCCTAPELLEMDTEGSFGGCEDEVVARRRCGFGNSDARVVDARRRDRRRRFHCSGRTEVSVSEL